LKHLLFGEVTKDMAEKVFRLVDKKPKSLQFVVNSGGGDVEAGLAIYDALKTVPKVTILATGECSSSALLFFQAATVRLARPSTFFICHKVRFVYGQEKPPPDSAEKAEHDKQMDFLNELLPRIYIARTGAEGFRQAMGHNIFGVKQAIEWGFLDGVDERKVE